jgi:hypothetical protein
MLKAAQPHAAASMRNVMDKTPLMMLLETKSGREKCSAFHDGDGQLLPLVRLLVGARIGY